MIILPMVELTSETQLVEQRTEQAVCQGRVFPCTQEESAAQRNGQTPKQPHVRSPVLVSEVRLVHLCSGRVHEVPAVVVWLEPFVRVQGQGGRYGQPAP